MFRHTLPGSRDEALTTRALFRLRLNAEQGGGSGPALPARVYETAANPPPLERSR